MSSNDLLNAELPSDSESDDSDYVTEGEGSSSQSDQHEAEEIRKSSGSFKKEIRRLRIGKLFDELMEKEDSKFQSEDHSAVMIDPLMLEFQRRQPRRDPASTRTMASVMGEVNKYSNSVKVDEPVDVRKYKQLARSSLVQSDYSGNSHDRDTAVETALAGLSNAQIEVEEEVRYAGEVVRIKKMVERTSAHATRFENRKRVTEDQSASLGGGGLGSFQTYLNTIKSKRAVSSVEKSTTDWNQVKMNTEGLEQSLKANRGFIEKRAFLSRADAKEDDIRRDARRRKMMEAANAAPTRD